MRTRRGVSEIVASMVLLVITASLGLILYNMALSSTGSQESSLVYETDYQEKISSERFSILSVARTADDKINIDVMNYGKIDITLTDVYINGDRVIPFTAQKLYTQEIIPIKIDNFPLGPFNPNDQKEYNILLVSELGDKVAYTWKN